MTAPVRALVAYMEQLDPGLLDGVFADDAVIIDSFAPFVFSGPGATSAWAGGFAHHVAGHHDLRATLGAPQEFGRTERATTIGAPDTVFFSQPITWNLTMGGTSLVETGGLAVVLQAAHRPGDGAGPWRVRCTAWAATSIEVAEGDAS